MYFFCRRSIKTSHTVYYYFLDQEKYPFFWALRNTYSSASVILSPSDRPSVSGHLITTALHCPPTNNGPPALCSPAALPSVTTGTGNIQPARAKKQGISKSTRNVWCCWKLAEVGCRICSVFSLFWRWQSNQQWNIESTASWILNGSQALLIN